MEGERGVDDLLPQVLGPEGFLSDHFFPGHGRWNNHGKQRREPLARHQNRSIDGLAFNLKWVLKLLAPSERRALTQSGTSGSLVRLEAPWYELVNSPLTSRLT